mmetsp:Transcript_32190/g.88926  ORF Transcript_32190/g.88926 Transcript_32190/m.88926 type:complete len:203 (+) Transcript_32190:341-949(+)
MRRTLEARVQKMRPWFRARCAKRVHEVVPGRRFPESRWLALSRLQPLLQDVSRCLRDILHVVLRGLLFARAQRAHPERTVHDDLPPRVLPRCAHGRALSGVLEELRQLHVRRLVLQMRGGLEPTQRLLLRERVDVREGGDQLRELSGVRCGHPMGSGPGTSMARSFPQRPVTGALLGVGSTSEWVGLHEKDFAGSLAELIGR